MINALFEDCEIYNNLLTGISLNYVSKSWHATEPENEKSAMRNSIVRNCLSYNNIHPTKPGDTDGISGGHTYNVTYEDNIIFGNSDDGLDFYASI